MPNLKQKSQENKDAADILIANGKLSASVHCYYYSTFQLSKHVLCNYHNIDYKKQCKECEGKDSHKYIIEKLSVLFKGKSRFDGLDYKKYINILKRKRKKADYSSDTITFQDIELTKENFNKLNDIFNKCYKITI